jgi:hypothetical protein
MSASLIRTIHVACRELGLDEDARRALQLRVVGKASLKDMDPREQQAVVDALKKQGFKLSSKGRRKPAARADVRFAHVLWRLLHEQGAVKVAGAAGLNAFVRERFGAHWGAVPIDIDTLSDFERIRDVTEALKAMCKRAGISVTKVPATRPKA